MIYPAIYLFLPSACWWTAARRRRVRLRVGARLGVIALLQALLLTGRILHPLQITLNVTLTIAAIAVLIRGLRQESGVTAGAWWIVGRILTIVYCIGAGCALALAIAVFGLNGRRPSTPPSSLLPLPAGFTVLTDTDDGCGDGSICDRVITVAGPPGVPLADAERLIEAEFQVRYGWSRFTPEFGGMDANRTEGLLLDHTSESVMLSVSDGHVVVGLTDE